MKDIVFKREEGPTTQPHMLINHQWLCHLMHQIPSFENGPNLTMEQIDAILLCVEHDLWKRPENLKVDQLQTAQQRIKELEEAIVSIETSDKSWNRLMLINKDNIEKTKRLQTTLAQKDQRIADIENEMKDVAKTLQGIIDTLDENDFAMWISELKKAQQALTPKD